MGFFPTLSSSPPLSNSLLMSAPSSIKDASAIESTTATTTSPYPMLLKPTTIGIEATDNSIISKIPISSSSKGGKKKRVTGTSLFSNASVRSYKS